VLEAIDALAGNPHRLGKRLGLELEGSWGARRGPYRIIYEIDESKRTVTVVAVGHRANVYRRR
jgi:mRNA-degrading endonuclease RelE of RelBE toxin-antitoxin system